MMRAVVIPKGSAAAGEGTRIAIQHGLFLAFAEMHGGETHEGSISQVLFADMPEGDVSEGKKMLNAADMWSVAGWSGSEKMAARLAAASEGREKVMGMAVLCYALDRLESRYDMYDVPEMRAGSGTGADPEMRAGSGTEAPQDAPSGDAPVRRRRAS